MRCSSIRCCRSGDGDDHSDGGDDISGGDDHSDGDENSDGGDDGGDISGDDVDIVHHNSDDDNYILTW